MRDLIKKTFYFSTMLARKVSGNYFACPNCLSESSKLVARKYLILELRRCDVCHLLFRSPIDRPGEGENFYETEYDEEFTTTLPNDEELQRLIATLFSSTDGDYGKYIDVLERLGIAPGSLIYDFGCSWGYGAFQLSKRGYRVEAYEVAKHRRDYARDKLGVLVDNTFPPARYGSLDCFLCAHVLEHVPSIEAIIVKAIPLLKPGGFFVSFTPNGSVALRNRWPRIWRHLWGRVHPNFLDDIYWRNRFPEGEYVITSDIEGDEKIGQFPKMGGQLIGRLNEWELLFALRKRLSPSV